MPDSVRLQIEDRTIDLPVVVGSEDKMTPPRATSQLVAGLSDVDLKHLDGIGHMMMIEAPDRIRDILLGAFQ